MRVDGYAPIEDYALVGDGRTAALVARDGAIDWLCLPNLDSQSVFGALLDAARGGTFELQPSIPFDASRRYLPRTNVLETTFTTDRGSVRAIDAMTMPNERLAPMRELGRSIEGLSGRGPMRWRFAPRFPYGSQAPRCEWRQGVPVAIWSAEAVGIANWGAGTPAWHDAAVAARIDAGTRARLAMTAACAEARPARPAGDRVEAEGHDRVLAAHDFRPVGSAGRRPQDVAAEGHRRPAQLGLPVLLDSRLEFHDRRVAESVVLRRSALAVLVVHAGNGADRTGGTRAVPARRRPRAPRARARSVRLPRVASRADRQRRDRTGATRHLRRAARDGVAGQQGRARAPCRHRRRARADRRPRLHHLAPADSGIWEVRTGPFHFTHSKVMCWVALDRAARLADLGEVPSRHASRWRRQAAAIRAYVEQECWSDDLNAYTRIAGSADVDASLLMLPIIGYADPGTARIRGTIDAVNRTLGHGDVVDRYHADDGVPGGEGCFLSCSFWLVGALARCGGVEDATALMERLVSRANDVGLYAEEIDPKTGAFLGNFPQALVHLALIDAAVALSGSRASLQHRQAS